MDDEPGSSSSAVPAEENPEGETSDSSRDSTPSIEDEEQSAEDSPPSRPKPMMVPVRPHIKHIGHRVNLLDFKKDKEDTESLYVRAQKMMASKGGKADIKLPTTSAEYYDLEEILMNPARMESGELSLNVYDAIRNTYNVLPGKHTAETNFQKVIGCFSCDVCQEVIQHSIVNKKCGHRFCDQCILVSIMRSGNTCPTCRQNLGSKRELQQDPRFDQLIDQVIESRTIVHRMMAENRDHEKDIYFGRYGYIEGERDWNKRYGITTGAKEPKLKELDSKKRTIEWFDDDETGEVPKPVNSKNLPEEVMKDINDEEIVVDGVVNKPIDPRKIVVDEFEGVCSDPEESEEEVEEETDEESEPDSSRDSSEDSEREGDDSEDDVIEIDQPEKSADTVAPEVSKTVVDKAPEVSKVRKFKKKASIIDCGLEDSEGESDEDVPAAKGKAEKTSSNRSSRQGTPEIIDGDIPTPSEDSLTSSGEEEERRAGAYDFVFEDEFNRDPRRDGHPEKDKLFNFDFMIDMDAQVNRKYEEDGVERIVTDDSNSEPSEEEDSEEEKSERRHALAKEIERKIRESLKNREKVGQDKSGAPSEPVVIEEDDSDDDFEIDESAEVDEEVEEYFERKDIDEFEPQAEDDQMFEGFLFRSNNDSLGRPAVQQDLDFQGLESTKNPTDVFVVYPKLVVKEDKVLEVSPKDWKIPIDDDVIIVSSASESTSSNSSDVSDEEEAEEEEMKEDKKVEDEEESCEVVKEQTKPVSPEKFDLKTVAEKTSENEVSTLEGAGSSSLVSENLAGDSEAQVKEKDKTMEIGSAEKSSDAASQDLSTSTKADLPIEDSTTSSKAKAASTSGQSTTGSEEKAPIEKEVEVIDLEKEPEPEVLIVGEKKGLARTKLRLKKFVDEGDWSKDDLQEIWTDMQMIGLDHFTRDELHHLMASTKVCIKQKVFYDNLSEIPHKTKRNKVRRQHVKKLNKDEIARITQEQTNFEENKIHRRRLALLNSVETIAAKLDIRIESSESEEEEDEDDEVEEGEQMEELQLPEEGSPRAETASPSTSLRQASTPPNAQATESPTVAPATNPPEELEVETPSIQEVMETGELFSEDRNQNSIDTFLFDDDQPCSSAQADARDKILERMEMEQKMIEDSIKAKVSSPPKSPTFKEPLPPATETEGVFKKPKTPERLAQNADPIEEITLDEEQEKGPEVMEVDNTPKEKPVSDVNPPLELDESSGTIKAFLTLSDSGSDVSDEEDSEYDEDFDFKFHSVLSDIDSHVLKPTITEHVCMEYTKIITPQPTPNDVPQAMKFMCRDFEKDYEMLYKTGKQLPANSEDARLEEFVRNFRKDYAAKHPTEKPVRSTANFDRKLLDKSLLVRSKHLIDMDPLQMQILIALQKQQIAAGRGNMSTDVSPQEHAEQVALLHNLQNPVILQPLMQNPEFAATLAMAQQQAVRQQQIQQKAIQQKEIDARRAEQARVEEIALKRIAQEKAELEEAKKKEEMEKMGMAGQTEQINSEAANSPQETETLTQPGTSDTSVSVDPDPSDASNSHDETILAGNVTHVVEKTIDESKDESEEKSKEDSMEASKDLPEMTVDNTIPLGECSTTQYEENTIDIDEQEEEQGPEDDQENTEKIREEDLNREMISYVNRYHQGTMVALNEKGVLKHHRIAKQLRESQELQELIALHEARVASGVTTEYVAKPVEDEDEEKEEEPEFKMDQLELAKSILRQDGQESSDESEESEEEAEEAERDKETSVTTEKMPREQRPPTPKQEDLFIPVIPMKVRQKFMQDITRLKRLNHGVRLGTAKKMSARLARAPVPQKPQPPPPPHFAKPQLPAPRGKHPATPRGAPKPKKIKMANVGAPTKITAVPNVAAAGYLAAQQHQQQQQQQQQQMYAAMSQVPQSTPIRPNPQPTPSIAAQQQSHLAQLGQFVHGNTPVRPAVDPQALAKQQAMQQAAQQQAAQLAAQQAAQLHTQQVTQQLVAQAQAQLNQSQLGSMGPQVAHAQAELIKHIQAQMAAQRAPPPPTPQAMAPAPGPSVAPVAQATPAAPVPPGVPVAPVPDNNPNKEMNVILQILQSRGQFPPTDEKAFLLHFAQAQAEYQTLVNNQKQMVALQAAQVIAAREREQLLMKQAQEQAQLQAAAKEAEKKAKAEAERKKKAEAEARRREREERARKAKEEAAARERIKQENQRKARLEDAARNIQAFRNHTMRGSRFTEDQKQKINEIYLMPDLPQHLKEEIKQIAKHQEQVELMKRAMTPMPAMPHPAMTPMPMPPMTPIPPMTPMPGMPAGFPGFIAPGFIPPGAPQQPGLQQPGTQQPSAQEQFLNQLQQQQMLQAMMHQQAQQAQQQAWMAPGFHPQQFLLQQQMQMQQLMTQAGHTQLAQTPAPQPLPQRTPAPAQTPLPQAVAVPKPVVPTGTPAIVVPTPRPATQAAQPDPSASKRVELELWPTNGYSEKKNHRDPMFFAVEGTANVRHVACLVRNRLMCDDVTSLWGLRLEDHCVKQFHPDEQLAVVQQFVGQQHVIMFYDDENAGQTPQSSAYVVHSNFKPHTGQRTT
ncbi:hypothetical protein B9Z55_024145 [Caenorhabditis nigoni]|uniref:RING-type E3 ubiquitin transferase n=1 Tax=Caenorhabditis nigoni TaxID=1611254 RepID=A0A2G5SSM8_9PELO|nr:hypothetical protein B9Z55_024145 [Caenorhabditis nigoni]